MSHVKDYMASVLRQQVVELQSLLKALEDNSHVKQDYEFGLEILSDIESQLKTLRQELKKQFKMN